MILSVRYVRNCIKERIYMPVKQNIEYLLIGFVFAAYLNVPVLGVAIVGAALGFKLYKDQNRSLEMAVSAGGEQYDDE